MSNREVLAPTVSVGAVVELVRAGHLALELWRATEAEKFAREAYFRKIKEYERERGQLKDRLDPRRPEHAEVLAYTADRYETHQTAKKKVASLKRRLRHACQKVARQSAMTN